MMNGLYVLQDDLGANDAPEEAHSLLMELIEGCGSDYRSRFRKKPMSAFDPLRTLPFSRMLGP
jgi:hypothetical protein